MALCSTFPRPTSELLNVFDRREVSKDFVTLKRYVRCFQVPGLDRDAAQANRDYLAALGSAVYPPLHAEDICWTLAKRGHRLYLVTNAVAPVQRSRLKNSVFAELVAGAFISEDTGASKPDKVYFDDVLSCIPGASVENSLIIGDSLATDIRGANDAGLPCCWFNPKGRIRQDGLRIDYEISDLRQLLNIV